MRIIVKGDELAKRRNRIEVMMEIAKYITVNYAIPIEVDAGVIPAISANNLLNMQCKDVSALIPAINIMREFRTGELWVLKPYGNDFVFIMENANGCSGEIHSI